MNQEQIEKNIAFIIEQQAKFFADIEERKALGQQTDARLDNISRRLTRAIRLAIIEARQEREKRRAVDERLRAAEEQLNAKLNILIDAQIRYEEHSQHLHQQLVESQRQAQEQWREWQQALDKRLAESQARTEENLAEMSQAVTATNRRIDVLENGTPVKNQ
jgi:hypothetical protein